MIKAIGGWLLLDGIGSIILYYGKTDHSGQLQTWRHDHWLRLARVLIGLYLIFFA